MREMSFEKRSQAFEGITEAAVKLANRTGAINSELRDGIESGKIKKENVKSAKAVLKTGMALEKALAKAASK